MNNDQPDKALQSILESAEIGFPPAYHAVALFYYNGWGVEKDMEKVLKYLQQGVDLGEENAEYMMSNLYYNGDGVEKDIPKALAYLEKAAEKGHANAQYDLGENLLMGTGIERDPIKGREWIQKAAEQNVARAQYLLGMLYFTGGGGLEKDKDQAIEWLQKAADQDFTQALPMIASVYIMDGNMEKAAEYYKKGAILENPTSMAFVGALYIYGTYGTQRDYIRGYQMLKKAEEAGVPNYQVLAQCYENGWGTAKNKKLARKYKQQAEEDARNRNKKMRETLSKIR
jgi:TPR repeat protein